jgi:hypothetical protein
LAPFCQAVSEKKIFLTLANQKQELPLAAITNMAAVTKNRTYGKIAHFW